METPVTFQCEGQQVVGMYHLPKGVAGDAPAVLFLHGFTGDKIEPYRIFVLTARRLAAAGIAALRIDFRGSGDSDGDFADMSLSSETTDAGAALDYLRTRGGIDVNRIGLLGYSMGGMIASLYLGAHSGVRSACLWSPVAHPEREFAFRAHPEWESDMAAAGATAHEGWLLGPTFIEEIHEAKPIGAVSACGIPVLLIHGDRDEAVSVQGSHDYEAAIRAAGGTVEKLIIAGADHGFSTPAWQETVQSTTVNWFRETLAQADIGSRRPDPPSKGSRS